MEKKRIGAKHSNLRNGKNLIRVYFLLGNAFYAKRKRKKIWSFFVDVSKVFVQEKSNRLWREREETIGSK